MSGPVIITARASSLPTFADCAARWYAQQVERISSPPGPRTILGSATHYSTALHDQAIIDGNPLRPDESAGAALDYLREHRDEVNWRGLDDDDTPLRENEVQRISVALHTRYCTEIAPTRRYSAVEPVLGSVEIDCGNGVVVRLTGQADRIREELVDGEPTEIVSDEKTGARAVNARGEVDVKGHVFQVASYKVLRRTATGKAMNRKTEIIGLATGKTPESQRVGVGYCLDAEETLIGTPDQPGLLQAIAQAARSGLFIGNPKSSLCSARYCPIFNNCFWRK